ncbi:hypothetical protein FH972_004497 [Carpinus fangiana]|uniref:Uncharacterized protein n=1 Tax=Carpinus fangiana TaxID=176857 RepID=A0A5N6QP24_9ROSI|nr:hypothetical protein FH972_004497 [Carpinus fangiana]
MTQLSEKDQLGASSVTSCRRRSTREHKLDEAGKQDPKFISQSNNLPESGDDSGEVTTDDCTETQSGKSKGPLGDEDDFVGSFLSSNFRREYKVFESVSFVHIPR